MTDAELRVLLDTTMAGDRPHVEKITVAAAVISEVLRARGMQATLVGGGAIEFHAPEVYSTGDLDLIVEGRSRAEIDIALNVLGFMRRGRHWVLGDLFVEIPGNWMSDPVEIVNVGPLQLRVVRREVVLADRIIGFKHWRATAYGAQALALLAVLGDDLDEDILLARVRAEDAEDALSALRAIFAERRKVSDVELQGLLDQLRNRGDR